MEKIHYGFKDFLSQVEKHNKDFVKNTHDLLVKEEYKVKIEAKKAGMFISYTDPKSKKVLLNFLFRKQGLNIRLYADINGRYAKFFKTFPVAMEKEIAKATVCKRLIDLNECWDKCSMGYDVYIGKNHYQKCRFSCFQFLITDESIPILSDFIKKELTEKRTVKK
jgi:hypothetical protein